MDASSVPCGSSCSSGTGPDEANNLLALSSSSLPPSHYLQTCPHLLTTATSSSPNPRIGDEKPEPVHAAPSGSLVRDANRSVDNGDQRRQSLRNDVSAKGLEKKSEIDLSNSCRSTSSPQLVGVKPRSKVYRRASLKSLTNISVMPPLSPPAQSRIIKVSSRNGKSEKRAQASTPDSSAKSNGPADDDKENVACNPLSSPYPYSTPCQKNNKSNKALSEESSVHQDEEKRSKGKSCGSFLPILSLIPHTVISFQYPSPKMKFSWWRNKIS